MWSTMSRSCERQSPPFISPDKSGIHFKAAAIEEFSSHKFQKALSQKYYVSQIISLNRFYDKLNIVSTPNVWEKVIAKQYVEGDIQYL